MSEFDGIIRMEIKATLSDGTRVSAALTSETSEKVTISGNITGGYAFLNSLSESMEHDGLFFDSGAMHAALLDALGSESDDAFSTLEALAFEIGVPWTHQGFQNELDQLVKDGEVVLKYSHGTVPTYAWKDA